MMLRNNQDPDTVALIVPDKEQLKRYVEQTKPGMAWDSKEAKELALLKIQEIINDYKGNGIYAGIFPERWLPAAIGVLPEAFTEQNQFLNSSLKMVRGKIEKHYTGRLDYLYTPEGKNIINAQNLEAL
jgi:long-chain acyl-CoA synthetase